MNLELIELLNNTCIKETIKSKISGKRIEFYNIDAFEEFQKGFNKIVLSETMTYDDIIYFLNAMPMNSLYFLMDYDMLDKDLVELNFNLYGDISFIPEKFITYELKERFVKSGNWDELLLNNVSPDEQLKLELLFLSSKPIDKLDLQSFLDTKHIIDMASETAVILKNYANSISFDTWKEWFSDEDDYINTDLLAYVEYDHKLFTQLTKYHGGVLSFIPFENQTKKLVTDTIKKFPWAVKNVRFITDEILKCVIEYDDDITLFSEELESNFERMEIDISTKSFELLYDVVDGHGDKMWGKECIKKLFLKIDYSEQFLNKMISEKKYEIFKILPFDLQTHEMSQRLFEKYKDESEEIGFRRYFLRSYINIDWLQLYYPEYSI